ncbi:MAG: NADH-ubiquinone oxidoreductase-F iron-sulfur binding region domain-containing protein [Halobacteriales archaeon]
MSTITPGDGAVLRVSDAGTPGLIDAAGDADVPAVTVGRSGVPAVEPLVSVTREGRTTFHAGPGVDALRGIAATAADGDLPTGVADAVVDHEPGVASLPSENLEMAGLGAGQRRVLGGCGWRAPADPDDHAAAGGFVDADPAAVRRAGADLRGRGWGDWSHDETLSGTWETATEAAGETAVVANAHGTPADALLLESVPFEVLEGAAAVARVVDADRAIVYVSEADGAAVERARAAIDACPDPPVELSVVAGPPEYRAAEPTMAIEAIEGNHRLEARLRPPGPETVGLHGRPTVVHTARTLAQLALALRDGTDTQRATRLVTVTGDVADPVTVELPPGERIGRAVDATAVEDGFKAACVGGRFGGLTGSLDVAADPDALAEAGLGTEGVVEVLAEDRCVVEFVGKRAQFAAAENCGRCVPCREGTTQLADLLRELYDGRYRGDAIAELDRVMRRTSICTFGVDAGRPVRTAMDAFDAEFEAHAEGRCPAGVCTTEVTA